MEILRIDLQTSNHIDKNFNNSYTEDKFSKENNPKIPKGELSKNIKYTYQVDQDTGKILIKVYDFLTGEVIQEIPSDKFLSFIKELKKGIDDESLKKHQFIPVGLLIENEV